MPAHIRMGIMIKLLHITTALVSISLFCLRFYWLMTDAAHLRRTWVRVLPHINDSVLLVTAVVLAVQLQQYPLVQPWLTVKLAALLAYIGFGFGVFRLAKTRAVQIICFTVAVALFIFILGVARSHNPWGLLAGTG